MMARALQSWSEPLPPNLPSLKHPYRDGLEMHRALQMADHIARTFSHPDGLSSALHMALIEALDDTAKVQCEHPNVGKPGYERAMFEPEPHDGFYTYHGSIDTSYVAEYLHIVAQCWLAHQRTIVCNLRPAVLP